MTAMDLVWMAYAITGGYCFGKAAAWLVKSRM